MSINAIICKSCQGQKGICFVFWKGVQLILLLLGPPHPSGNEKCSINQRAGIHGPLMNHEPLPMVNKKSKFSHLTSVITMQKLFSSVPQKCLQNLQYCIPPAKKSLILTRSCKATAALQKFTSTFPRFPKLSTQGAEGRQQPLLSSWLWFPQSFLVIFFPLIEACASFPIPRHRARMWPESRLQKGFVHFQFCQVPSFNHFFSAVAATTR